MRSASKGMVFWSIISSMRGSFITLALTRSRWARDLNTIQENMTVSLGLRWTLRGNEVTFPIFTSSATDSRNSSAPCSRQILPALRGHAAIVLDLALRNRHDESIDVAGHADLLGWRAAGLRLTEAGR